MAPSKKCFPLQPGALFRFSRIFKLSQSAYTSNLPFSKMCFLPRRGAPFCFFPLLMISPKTCKSNLSAFPPFLNASWGLLGSPWNNLGPSRCQLYAKLAQLGASSGEPLPGWGQLGLTCGSSTVPISMSFLLLSPGTYNVNAAPQGQLACHI